ncbi:MAG: GAF domain-containing protein [Actinomycetes bacterium]
MARVLVVSRNPAMAMGLSATDYDVVDLRPDGLGTWVEGSDNADALVLDLEDPSLALSAVTHLRARAKLAPVLLVSSDRQGWDAPEMRRLPAAEVLPLPVSRPALLSALEDLMNQPWNNGRTAVIPTPDARSTSARPGQPFLVEPDDDGDGAARDDSPRMVFLDAPHAAEVIDDLLNEPVVTLSADDDLDALIRPVTDYDPLIRPVTDYDPPISPIGRDEVAAAATSPSPTPLHVAPLEGDPTPRDDSARPTVPRSRRGGTRRAPSPKKVSARTASPKPVPDAAAMPTISAPTVETDPAAEPETPRPRPAPAQVRPIEAAVQKFEGMSLVQQLFARLNELNGVPETADVVIADAVERTRADAGTLMVPDDGHWRVAGGVNLRNLEHRYELYPESWLVETVARGNKGVIIEDSDVARRALQGAPLASWRHLLAAPVPLVEGLLLLARRQDPPFDETDLAVLATLGEEAGPLLKSAVDTRRLARALWVFRDEDDPPR